MRKRFVGKFVYLDKEREREKGQLVDHRDGQRDGIERDG